nr:hypothetical protein CFP56_03236 [Quercus suber]
MRFAAVVRSCRMRIHGEDMTLSDSVAQWSDTMELVVMGFGQSVALTVDSQQGRQSTQVLCTVSLPCGRPESKPLKYVS